MANVMLPILVIALPIAVGAQSPSPTSCPSVSSAIAGEPTAPPSAAAEDLIVFAAASLSVPFADLQAPWSDRHPGSDLVYSFDSSAALRAQVDQGAPADVFASADRRNPQALVDACLAPGPITLFAANQLAIVVPAGNPAGIASPADLARPDLRLVAAGRDVPITTYAVATIDNLAALPNYPAGFAAAVAANVVSEEDNVKAVLAKIELGEGDAALVYLTDAASSTAVETIAIPEEANVVATYAAVAIAGSPHGALAADFLAFLTGPEAQSRLAGYGFLPAP